MNLSILNKNTPILIVGAGSIGERHIRNLWTLGYRNLTVWRREKKPFRDIGEAKIETITDRKELLVRQPQIAFITTVTSLHTEMIIECLHANMHIFVEKPLAHNLLVMSEIRALVKEKKRYFFVGYMMRFHPHILTIKQMIDQEKYGRLLHIQSKWGEYLPDWHPWEDYRISYAAKAVLGGGAALTLSHDLDLVFFLTEALPEISHIIKNRKSNLDVDVEAGADIIMALSDGVTANVHLNFFERNKERFLRLIFDEATICFDFFEDKLTIKTPNNETEDLLLTDFERNDMFVEQTKYFLSKIDNFIINEALEQIEISETIIKICNNGQ